jgi:D-Tyr-tRNAtyr deacylase
MIAVLQRCSRAAVISVGLETGCLVLLLGVVKGDDEADAAACNKMRPWQ